MGVYDTDSHEYNLKLAETLKKMPDFKMPEWAEYVKSSPSKSRPIDDPDFWHKRAASILKQIYNKKIVGVNRLRTRYGSKKNKGYAPAKYGKAGGKIIRTVLQQADKAGLTEIIGVKDGKGKRAGRQLTKKGKELLDSIK